MSDEQGAQVRALATSASDTGRGRNPVTEEGLDGHGRTNVPDAAVSDLGGGPHTQSDDNRAAHEPPASAEITYHFAYEPTPECVGQARHEVEVLCGKHGIESFGPVLVVSELVTNALPFAECVGTPIELAVHVNPSVMLLEVADPAVTEVPALDDVQPPSDEAISGRGLLLVKGVSDGLEVVVDELRKAICARFERDGDGTSLNRGRPAPWQ